MKKLKIVLSTLAFFVILNTANAQQIEQETVSSVDETEILVNNGRRMMLHYVRARNFERVAEIYHLLNARTHEENCVAFSISEEFLITALIKNWDYFFTLAEHFFNILEMDLCIPIHDQRLFNALFSAVQNNTSQILENASSADLAPKEKQLLKLYLHFIEHGTNQTYRQKLQTFREGHSQSEFNDFVRSYFPRAPIRVDMGFSVGVTHAFPMGDFGNYFSSTTISSLTGDFIFERFLVGIQIDIGTMRLNTPLLSSTTNYREDFQEGDRFQYIGLSIPVGYTLIRNNRFELTPFVSFIGLTELKSNIYPRTTELDRTVISSFSVGAGLRTEFQLVRFTINSAGNSRLNLRLDVGYNRPVRFSYTPASGNLFYARAGIVWWFGSN